MKSAYNSLLIVSLQAFASMGWAGPSYDAQSPPCEVPIFHWTGPIKDKDLNVHVLKSTAGAIEANQTKWDPNYGRGDLAGRGAYFEADPFTSESYGNNLVIGYLKPRQPAKDLRALEDLDDQAAVNKSIAAIRSDKPLLIHRWNSKLGSSDAVVLRGSHSMKVSELPLNLKRTELVVVTSVAAKPWQDHKLMEATDTLGAALQKYEDRLIDLYPIWNSVEIKLTDEMIWSMIKAEISSAVGDVIGEIDVDRSGLHWTPFDFCGDFETADGLSEATKAFVQAKLINEGATPTSVCELKAQLVTQFKSSKGYERLASVNAYLQSYKRQLGIPGPSRDGEVGPSTLSASCKPLKRQ